MKQSEIQYLRKKEREAFDNLLFAEKHYGMNDQLTVAWRLKWGQIYDILNDLGITPIIDNGVEI